jgi:hypothetical protein
MPGSDSPDAVGSAGYRQPGQATRRQLRLLTGEFFQIGFDFADLIGDHAFQMA